MLLTGDRKHTFFQPGPEVLGRWRGRDAEIPCKEQEGDKTIAGT